MTCSDPPTHAQRNRNAHAILVIGCWTVMDVIGCCTGVDVIGCCTGVDVIGCCTEADVIGCCTRVDVIFLYVLHLRKRGWFGLLLVCFALAEAWFVWPAYLSLYAFALCITSARSNTGYTFNFLMAAPVKEI